MSFCSLLILSSKFTFFNTIFSRIESVSNSLDPDQAQHFVGPNLGPKYLHRFILASGTSK